MSDFNITRILLLGKIKYHFTFFINVVSPVHLKKCFVDELLNVSGVLIDVFFVFDKSIHKHKA
jgi:hypothetical protein